MNELIDLPSLAGEHPASGPFVAAEGAPVERRRGLSRSEFFHDYARKHRPVIIADALHGWPALTKWKPEFFAARYPGKLVKFKDGSQLPMSEFIDRVLNSTPGSPAPYWTNAPLVEHFPDLLSDINPTLTWFAPNWGTRRFLHKGLRDSLHRGATIEIYIGGNGGAFPIVHWDGLSTHAFLMQIFGRKRYYVWPPDDSPCLYPKADMPNVSPIRDIENPDLATYPLFAKARLTSFVLEPGELLFVPSRWWHTAKMLTPSITLSINTVNASNWANFAQDMTRRSGAAARPVKKFYLGLSALRNRLVDAISA